MAKQTLNTIKSWFRTGLKASQRQYWDTLDSFWHRDKKIPIDAIDELDTRLNEAALDINSKVDKVAGKGLSSKDFTTIEQAKLAGIASGATTNKTDVYLLNRANHTGTQQINTVVGLQGKLDQKADLVNGKVSSSQLPAFIDDVFSYSSIEGFPSTGESGKIYISENTNKIYRWSGTAYSEFSAGAVLGETAATAYRGDRGKTAYDHSQLSSGNPHHVSKSDIGLSEVNNTSDADKPVSAAMQTALDTKIPAMTVGSVVFSNGTSLAEDNGNLVWDNTNKRLGVGTTPSAAALEIYSDSATGDVAKFSGSGRGGGVFKMQSTNVKGYAGFNVVDENDTLAASLQYGNSSSGSFTNQFVIASRKSTTPVAFWTVSTGTSIVERMRIQPVTGNVGIATTTPSEKLDVNGNIKATELIVSGNIEVEPDKGIHTALANQSIVFSAGTTNILRLGNWDGNGWSDSVSPNGFFQLGQNQGFFTGQAGAILNRFGISSQGTTFADGKWNSSGFKAPDALITLNSVTSSKDILNIYGSGSQTGEYVNITSSGGNQGDIFTILSSGNIGINTTSPTEKLDVNGNIRSNSLSGAGDRSVIVSSTGILKAGNTLRTSIALTTPFVNTTNVAADVTGWTMPVTTGKQYRIEIIADYQTAATTTGCVLMFNLASGTGTIKGSLQGAIANTSTIVGVATDLTKTITAVTGTANSGIQTSGVSAINTPHFLGGTVVFQCTASGTLNLRFASEVTNSSAQLNKGSILLVEEI